MYNITKEYFNTLYAGNIEIFFFYRFLIKIIACIGKFIQRKIACVVKAHLFLSLSKAECIISIDNLME